MHLTELRAGNAALLGLSNINVILGRNGAGKSRFLREIESGTAGQPSFNVRYLSPERAGVFRRDGNIQNAMEQNKDWLRGNRAKNQSENFKAASAHLLRELELAYLRRLEATAVLRSDPERTFRGDRLDKINRLLSNISINQEAADLVFRSSSGAIVQPDQISSGESEAVSLAAEIMYFFETLDVGRFNVLLLDEPDVHLHPDLQARLGRLLISELDELPAAKREKVAVCIATHSTPLVCALAASPYTTIGTKNFECTEVSQFSATDALRKSAPFFGHPLSLSLSNDVALIVEGEDDERVWQQAARSSNGRMRLFPIVASSVDQQTEVENACVPLLMALYDAPVAYSVRDGDGVRGDLPSVGPVIRFRLQCYAIENTLLTDECLAVMGKPWALFKESAAEWVAQNPTHRDVSLVEKIVAAPDRLRDTKVKAIRQLICSIAGITKPWEVVVGQAIAAMDASREPISETSLLTFVGTQACKALLLPRALP
jgi:predicted ATPase